MSWSVASAEEVDLVANLYTPAGVPDPDNALADDYLDYVNGAILELVSANDSTVIIYAPEAVLGGVPDPMIKRYDDIMIAIDIGPIASPNEVTWLVGELNEISRKVTGTANNTRIMVDGNRPSVWLTDAEYAAIVADRASRIESYKPMVVVIEEKNQTISSLSARIAALEAYITAHLPP